MTEDLGRSEADGIVAWRLVIGTIATCVIALSIHVGMLQGLNIPFPDLSVLQPPVKYVLRVVVVLGLLVLCRLAFERRPVGFAARWLVMFLMLSMLSEVLIRAWFMAGYCTDAMAFALVGGLPRLATNAVTSGLVAAVAVRFGRPWQTVLAALVIAAIGMFAAPPLVGMVLKPVIASVAQLAPQGEWCRLPYGAEVLWPAYLTFMEPAIAAVVMAMLVWHRLSSCPGVRLIQFSVLVLAIKGQLLLPFVYALLAKSSFGAALLSESQFALQALALAVLAGLTWSWSLRRTGR